LADIVTKPFAFWNWIDWHQYRYGTTS